MSVAVEVAERVAGDKVERGGVVIVRQGFGYSEGRIELELLPRDGGHRLALDAEHARVLADAVLGLLPRAYWRTRV